MITPNHSIDRPDIQWFNLLPEELVSFCLIEAYNALDHPSERLRWTFEVQLVCHHWRAIALATPSLWTSLYIPNSLFVYGTGPIHRSVGRSGVLPLEVEVKFESNVNFRSAEGEACIPTDWHVLLVAVADRVRKLHINVEPEGGLIEAILRLVPSLPNLREIEVSDSEVGWMWWPYHRSYFPRLRSLHLTSDNLDWGVPCLEWKNLIDLRVRQINPVEVTTILPYQLTQILFGSPGLRVLELENQNYTGILGITYLRPVFLGHLELLILTNQTRRGLQVLFYLIDAPGLETLKIEAGRPPSFNEMVPLDPRFPGLKTLVLQDTELALEIACRLSSSVRDLVLLGERGSQDSAFSSLVSHWEASAQALPMETLTTGGVSLSALAKLHRIRPLLPSIRKIVISADAFDSAAPIRGKGHTHSFEERKLVLERLVHVEVEAIKDIRSRVLFSVFQFHPPTKWVPIPHVSIKSA